MKKTLLKKYAEMIVKTGVNVKKGQDVIIRAGFDQIEFVNMVAEYCYKCKANKVMIDWENPTLTKLDYKYRSFKSLCEIPSWEIEKQKYMTEKLPCMIYLESADPDGLKGIDQELMAKVKMNTYPIIKPFRDARENKYQWVIAGVPGEAWAKKVFPNLSKKKAVEALWEAILKTSRAYNDAPIKTWDAHNKSLKEHVAKLNALNLEYLEYHANNGTDFKVWLMKDGLWLAGSEFGQDSHIEYSPNIPTEECFTTPDKNTAEGIVYSSKPLSYQGQLIEDFSIRFHKGKVVEVKARKNEELLKKMVSMDEGACRLGECALVPYDSPINQTGLLFYNTLYDENAACHLALGMGFSNCVKDYEKYTFEEIQNKGVNDSMIHVDFMIGTKDLSVIGHSRDGKEIVIFKDGNWAI